VGTVRIEDVRLGDLIMDEDGVLVRVVNTSNDYRSKTTKIVLEDGQEEIIPMGYIVTIEKMRI